MASYTNTWVRLRVLSRLTSAIAGAIALAVIAHPRSPHGATQRGPHTWPRRAYVKRVRVFCVPVMPWGPFRSFSALM